MNVHAISNVTDITLPCAAVVGGIYRTRDGKIATVSARDLESHWPCKGSLYLEHSGAPLGGHESAAAWRENGSFAINAGQPHSWDLVEYLGVMRPVGYEAYVIDSAPPPEPDTFPCEVIDEPEPAPFLPGEAIQQIREVMACVEPAEHAAIAAWVATRYGKTK